MGGLAFTARMRNRRSKVERCVEMPDDATLEDLAREVVDAYGFDMDHAYGFYDLGYEGWGKSRMRYEAFDDWGHGSNGTPGCGNVGLGSVFRKAGDEATMLFDYGDGWLFDIVFSGEGTAEAGCALPRVTASKGRAPKQYC